MQGDSVTVTLVNPPSVCVHDDRLEPPLGLLYVAASARERGFGNVAVCDMSGCTSDAEAQRRIDTVPEAQIYGICCLCTNQAYVKRVVARIRRRVSSAYVIIGGPNPSALPDFTLADTAADAVVVGEGEDAFVRCLDSFVSGSPLRGILTGAARDDIDSYAFPERSLVDSTTYSRKLFAEPVVSLISSRGCPSRCAHCNSVVMGGGARRTRYRSPDNVAAEVQSLREVYKHFRFNDDSFTANPDLRGLLDRLRPLDIVFRAFARVVDLTPENCGALKAAGCIHVAVGLESLDPDNLKVLGKPEQIGQHSNIRVARDAGLVVRAYFMVGLPNDSDANIEQYAGEAASLGIDEFTVYPLIPYPGTQIAADPGRFGYTIANPDFRDYVQVGVGGQTCFALRHRNFAPEDVKRWKRRAEEVLTAGGAKDSRISMVAN